MTTPETNWIKELRESWQAAPQALRPKLKLAFTMSGTATSAESRAFAFRQAWELARSEYYQTDPRLLSTYRRFMRVAALEAVALARHYVLQTERFEQEQRARDAARYPHFAA